VADLSLYRKDRDSSLTLGMTPVQFDRRSGGRVAFSKEQDDAIRARGSLVTVSAGAGSGKTRVLVERFIDLVQRDGVSPLEILAITFTEKAAAEMKERIVRRFEEREDVANRRQAEAAYISTIHGFCSRILRENPLAARLDPSFHVIDELTQNIFLDEQLEAMYRDDWYVEHDQLFKSKRWESDWPLLFELIVEAAFLPGEFGTLGETEAGYTAEQHFETAMRRFREYWAAQWANAAEQLAGIESFVTSCVITGARAAAHQTMCDVIARLGVSSEPDPDLARRFVASTGFTGGLNGQAGADEIREVMQTLRKMFKEYSELEVSEIERVERETFAPLKVGIYERAASLRTSYEEFKHQHGFLDFEDMQRRALELLADESVRERYARHFKHILLDEAQDTNDVQMRIIDRLRDGRQSLFAVGDVKQAIYGFRGSNIEIFQGLCGDVIPSAARDRDYPDRGLSTGTTAIPRLPARDDSTHLTLADNYRSRAGVIDFVNSIGEQLWDDRSIEFQPLLPKFDYEAHGTDPRSELWLVEQVKLPDAEGKLKLEKADDVREREGVALAAWIRDTVEGDKPLTIYDREKRLYRRARYGDIAILSGTRTPFPAYERALADLGIPFVKDGGREFFRGREVLDLLAALRVIDNPLDDMSLLAALRSPLFGWGDRDLVRVRVAAGERALWYGLSAVVPNDSTASPDAYDILSRLRRHATLVAPVALIEMICDVTAYRAALLSLPRGRAQVANIDQLIEFARTTATLDGPSLSSFVHRATLAERYLGTHREAPLNVAGDDAVVISTVHGAKGLEWPIVLLAGLDGDLVRANAAARYSAPDGSLIVGFKVDEETTLRSAGNAAIVDAAKTREEAEARRLLYVAMTRARERLILTSRFKYEESKSTRPGLTVPIKWLASEIAIRQSDVETEVVSYHSAQVSVRHLTPDRIAPMRNAAAALQDARLAAARQAVRDGAPVEWDAPGESDAEAVSAAVGRALAVDGPAWASQTAIAQTTVTQLVYFFRCPLVYYFDLVLQMDENPRGRGKAGATERRRMTALDRGTHVHELLERADLSAAPDAEARRLTSQLAKRLKNLAPDESARIEKLVGAVLSDPLMDRARAATLIEREYPFYLKLGDTMVQGVIDLVFRDAHGNGVVVDYKSNDLAAPGRLATLTELYRPQIELYALAAKQAGFIQPNEATLYFLNGPTPVSTPIDEGWLEAVESQADNALARIGRSAWDTEPGEKCRGCGYRKRGYCEVGKRFEE